MGSPSWSIVGNAGTNATANFLGTTDAQPMVIKTGGAERLRVDTSGNVGIGTSSPGFPLHLNTGMTLRIEGGAGANDNKNYFSFGGNGTFGIDAPGVPNGRFVVMNNGNVGIGCANPAAALSLCNFDGVRQLLWDGGQNGTQDHNCGFGNFLIPAMDGLCLFMGYVNSTFNIVVPTGPWPYPGYKSLLSVLPAGQVGIGTTSPVCQLEVVGQAAFQGALTLNHAGVSGVGSPGDARAAITFGAIDTAAAFYLGEYDANAPKATGLLGLYSYQYANFIQFWAPNGNVGIGTGAPASKLHVVGDVTVTGDVILSGADCAEQFDVAGNQPLEGGTVVVIDDDGLLRESSDPYDRKVAGVVSGGGDYRHALVLDKRSNDEGRVPVALVGKVYCKVDANYSSIEVGDLLTTSPTPGHAMKASDPARAFGAVIGKALRSLSSGANLIPVLIALQ